MKNNGYENNKIWNRGFIYKMLLLLHSSILKGAS